MIASCAPREPFIRASAAGCARRARVRAVAPLAAVLSAVLLLPSGAGGGLPCGDPSGHAEGLAERTLSAMTQSEKLQLLRGLLGAPSGKGPKPKGAVGSAGYAPPIPRLGVPALQETDGELGVANPGDIRRGDTATAMPSNPALAATFDLSLARRQGESVGEEARARGFNVLLGGAANLIRDPRGGRTFEYFSEDPLLTGLMAGAQIAGVESRGVLSTMKHFALNDQETDRRLVDVRIDKAAARESDLLAFEIAYERGRPGAVMCAYNRVEGVFAFENAWASRRGAQRRLGLSGFVLSDWGAVHSTDRSANDGLDQEPGEEADARPFFADLGAAVAAGRVPRSRIDDVARRILASIFACGLAGDPAAKSLSIPSGPRRLRGRSKRRHSNRATRKTAGTRRLPKSPSGRDSTGKARNRGLRAMQ